MDVPAPRRGRGRRRTGRQEEPVQQPVPPVNPVPAIDPAILAQQFWENLTQIIGQGALGAQPVQDPFTIAYHEFLRHPAQRFDGCSGYDAADEWLIAIQKTFRLARTPAEHRTEIAATLFDKEAQHWWTSQEPQYQGDGPNIPWDWFTNAFRARFLGRAQRAELRRQFETLTQGDMTARQYGETFIRLSRYAPDLVTDPQVRRDRFIDGLDPALGSLMDIYLETTIESLMDRAEFQERKLMSRAKSRYEREKFDNGDARKLAPPANKQPGKQTSQQQPKGNNGFQRDRVFCKVCQRSYLGPCARHNGRCLLCHSPDHWKADCPEKLDRPLGNSAFRGSGQVNQPANGRMIGRSQEDPRRGQGGNQGRQPQGGQARQDAARVHATVGQEHPTTWTCFQCTCHPDSSG